MEREIKLEIYFINIVPNVNFTAESENQTTINYLDLTIRGDGTRQKFLIYRSLPLS